MHLLHTPYSMGDLEWGGEAFMDFSEIIPGHLYAGERVDKEGWRILARLHVNGIVNLSKRKEVAPDWFPPLRVLNFPLGNKEEPHVNRLRQAVDETIRWLNNGTIIYAHDVAGKNRLGFFLTALFMRMYHLPLEGALRIVKQLRPVLSPHRQFLQVLNEYEQTL
jgi:protein-tyrosine phosphatase